MRSAALSSTEEEEVAVAGWTTEKSPKGIEVLDRAQLQKRLGSVFTRYLSAAFSF